MSVPKIIHYCWFGGNPKPKLAEKCIKSWKKFCPDYQIIEWNEENFDVSAAPEYVCQAYAAKRWAFVTDYVRLKAMTEMGGIYMDTDVELVKPLTPFLAHDAFAGFETDASVQTGLLACCPGFPLFQEFLQHYDSASFVKSDGTHDVTTNVSVLTSLCREHAAAQNEENRCHSLVCQQLEDGGGAQGAGSGAGAAALRKGVRRPVCVLYKTAGREDLSQAESAFSEALNDTKGRSLWPQSA